MIPYEGSRRDLSLGSRRTVFVLRIEVNLDTYIDYEIPFAYGDDGFHICVELKLLTQVFLRADNR